MRVINTIGLAALAVAALSSGALAADLRYAPPPATPAPAYTPPAQSDWDGPYIGASVGYAWAAATDTTVTPNDTASPQGWLLGGQAGYNFHLGDTLVGGIEGNLDWSNETADFTGGTSAFDSLNVNWDGSVRGRLGLDVDGILPYVEAGVAFANATATSGADTFNGTHTGWTAGAGIEFKLADQLSANVEYRYTDYGTQTYDADTIGITDSAVRVGLNYHF